MPPEDDEQPIIVKKIIKKGGHGGHHGGAWKVAYADFVTAMMCLFLLLWLINVDPATKSAVSEIFKQPTTSGPIDGNVYVFGGAKRPGEEGQFQGGASFMQFEKLKLTEENKERVKEIIQTEFKESLELSIDQDMKDAVSFHVTEKGILIEIQEAKDGSLFTSGSSVATSFAKKIIDKLSGILRNNTSSMILAGHTDGQNYSLGSYDNWNLSTDRAHTVRARMEFDGINESRFVRVEGYADQQLKYPASPYDSMNRRITITLFQEEELQKLKQEQEDLVVNTPIVRAEQVKEQAVKRSGDKLKDFRKYVQKSAGKTAPTNDLSTIKRRKKRAAYYAKYTLTESGGGHGGGGEAEAEAEAAPAEEAGGGEHGGGGHGGGH
ncbi:MAG: flagellar motor protein MotB [Candidatus Caenarcaniphilales bacterium]|nr:flagellar motor protein MotB [Candidatus Caenarcaniphilales bacterium]